MTAETLISIILPCFAIVVAAVSAFYAWRSTSISREAHEHSKATAKRDERPRLTLNPAYVVVDGKPQYLGVTLNSPDNITFMMNFTQKNEGKTVAKNIQAKSLVTIRAFGREKERTFEYEGEGKTFSLDVGQKRIHVLSVNRSNGLIIENQELKKLFDADRWKVTADITVTYESDQGDKYETSAQYEVFKSNANHLRYDST